MSAAPRRSRPVGWHLARLRLRSGLEKNFGADELRVSEQASQLHIDAAPPGGEFLIFRDFFMGSLWGV
jgi:hypothetical protein